MNVSGRLFRLSLLSALISLTAAARADQQWTPPTPEELSMTSQPQVPGAAAVYLFREETTDDKLHMFSIYVRLKILNELGKEKGNVELNYFRGKEGSGFTVEDIQGRTIHPDGTIIPFTGKPYEKLVEKTHGVKVMAKVFSMPDVTIGSILEYRYKLRYDDMYVEAPAWYIQSNFWTRKAHYMWRPIDLSGNTSLTNSRGQNLSMISWTTVLPPSANIVQSKVPGSEQSIINLNVQDIPPMPDEDYMPPIGSFSYRVLFYFTAYRTPDEFWKNEGKYWAKQEDKFIGPGPVVSAAVKDIVIPSDTPEQKLRKIYAAVMKFENTRYTREHTTAEEKAQGFKEVHNADDIWTRKRGSDDQLTGLFVAMARAAGLKAYVGYLTSRDRSVFTKIYLSLSELDDMIAIVNIDGKDQFFDPGTRYCPYGHLTWKHTFAGGIRQTDSGGADFFNTPGESYTFSRVQRVAELKLDPQGALSGKIIMTYSGDPGVGWRHRALIGDSASLEREIRSSVESLVPASLQLKVVSINNVDNYEQPLTATLNVEGSLGTSTGKRVLLPGDIFEANTKPAFPHEKREVAVYFEYPRVTQDAIRITYPATLSVESLPVPNKDAFEKAIAYNLSSESAPSSFTIRRNYAVGDVVFTAQQYPNLRAFYSKMETKDQENVILTTVPAPAKPAGN